MAHWCFFALLNLLASPQQHAAMTSFLCVGMQSSLNCPESFRPYRTELRVHKCTGKAKGHDLTLDGHRTGQLISPLKMKNYVNLLTKMTGFNGGGVFLPLFGL